MVIFQALRATLVHFADFVTGHGTSCAPCAVRHTPGALCTFIRAYSMTRTLMIIVEAPGIATGKKCCTVLPEWGRAIISVYNYKAQ
jgi:hypothetical protein